MLLILSSDLRNDCLPCGGPRHPNTGNTSPSLPPHPIPQDYWETLNWSHCDKSNPLLVPVLTLGPIPSWLESSLPDQSPVGCCPALEEGRPAVRLPTIVRPVTIPCPRPAARRGIAGHSMCAGHVCWACVLGICAGHVCWAGVLDMCAGQVCWAGVLGMSALHVGWAGVLGMWA
jgi:hypothetical protein